ncbi:dual specificity protein phosphatase 12 [Aplysia californica]|uniref:protein-tyrosine-phosphatase n=1 Tax=Aplysia californica TaxID=6500 RepID=A0ABM0JYT0_APLCA|nr:dual specificity protein phosphatase 12 [Aplysia californica]
MKPFERVISIMETSDFIIEGLYLGPISSAKNEKDLRSKNITHVLSLLQKPLHEAVRRNRTFKNLPAIDIEGCNLLPLLSECFAFIDQARENHTGVLVHCQKGMSRSATVVIAYLMYKFNLSLRAAREKVRSCRPIICPNAGFEQQLLRFEAMKSKIIGGQNLAPGAGQMRKLNKKEKKVTDHGAEAEEKEEKEEEQESLRVMAEEASELQKPVQEEAESVYKCRKCRAMLFHKKDLTCHNEGDGEAAFDWRSKIPASQRPESSNHEHVPECKISLFVEVLPWMENVSSDSGKLHCPKCFCKIGSYVWHGEKCPCGAWVTPAFHIDSKKVDNFPSQYVLPLMNKAECSDFSSVDEAKCPDFSPANDSECRDVSSVDKARCRNFSSVDNAQYPDLSLVDNAQCPNFSTMDTAQGSDSTLDITTPSFQHPETGLCTAPGSDVRQT